MKWIQPLWFCLLPGVGSASFLVEHKSSRADTTLMSLPTFIQGFHPLPVAARKNPKPAKAQLQQLWYRDLSMAEEQMTQTRTAPTTLPTHLEKEEQKPSVTLPDIQDLPNPLGAVNLPLVQATCLSHAALFMVGSTVLTFALMAINPDGMPLDWTALHWNGDTAPFHSLLDRTLTPLRLAEGILATIPLVTLSTLIHNSDSAEFCPVHVRVTNTVLSLFGKKQEGTPMMTVLLLSLGIGAFSALSEELLFRGLLPTALVSSTHFSVELALVGQALLFGLGQIRPQSSLAENGVFSLMQALNGLWYGAVYLGTGGDILPVLIAHVLYECHIFVGTWKFVNDQLEYAEGGSKSNSNSLEQPSAQQLELDSLTGGNLKPETLDSCRRFFYAFDYDHQGSLSLANVKRAVAYAFLQDQSTIQPSDARTRAAFNEIVQQRRAASSGTTTDQEEEERINLSEFLHLLFALQSKKWNNQLA